MVILQELFDRPILESADLDPGIDENHGSLVFRVRTSTEEVVARSFRLNQLTGPFWGNLHNLFGINPMSAAEVAPIHTLLQSTGSILVPKLLRVGNAADREWIVVELMQGHPISDFSHLSDQGLVDFGRSLGRIHSQSFDWLGNPSGSVRFSPTAFSERLVQLFQTSLDRYPDDPRLSEWIAPMSAAAAQLPPPDAGVLIMPDISPYQFLQDKGQLVAMVDIDAYAVGPRELDFINLEYWFDQRSADLFCQGYGEILPLPQLHTVRAVYRYLCRILTIRTDIDYVERWMSWPELFF